MTLNVQNITSRHIDKTESGLKGIYIREVSLRYTVQDGPQSEQKGNAASVINNFLLPFIF